MVLCGAFSMSVSIEHISGGSLFNTNPRKVHTDRVGVQTRLDLHNLQSAVQHYYQQGLASSTQKSYQTGQHRYLTFCSSIKKSPLPTTEDTLFPNIELVRIALPAAEHCYVDIGYTSIFCCGSSNSKAMRGVQLVIDSGVFEGRRHHSGKALAS